MRLLADGLPSPADVTGAVERVLSRPEFRQPEPGWLERLIESFGEHLQRLSSWVDALLGGLAGGGWVQWLLIGWLALSLLAIVVHLIWSLAAAGRTHAPRPWRAGEAPGWPAARELLAEADRLALAGRHADAMHILYMAAVRGLDEQGRVRYAEAKTGGDYLAELGGDLRRSWRGVLASFYPVAFGGRPASPERWREMRTAATATSAGLVAPRVEEGGA